MVNEKILIGVANEGEQSFDVETVKAWTPKDILNVGDIVYFKVDKTYFSMKRLNFIKLFPNI